MNGQNKFAIDAMHNASFALGTWKRVYQNKAGGFTLN